MAMKVPVEEYTTPDPITATEDMSIDQLQILMDEFGVRHLPILRDGKVVGMVSDRDVRIARGLSEAEKFLICAGDIMAADPVTVRADTPIDDVAELMHQHKIGSVMVLENGGKLLGIFTATDALNALNALIEIIRAGGPAE